MRITASRGYGAFTRSDLMIIVVATSFLFVLWAITTLNSEKGKSPRVKCTANLRQIGLAFNLWLQDNEIEYFPMVVPESRGGSKQSVDNGQIVQTFLTL